MQSTAKKRTAISPVHFYSHTDKDFYKEPHYQKNASFSKGQSSSNFNTHHLDIASKRKKLTGIVPAISALPEFQGYHFVNAKKLGHFFSPSTQEKQKENFFSKILNSNAFIKFVDSWIYQDIWFVMNKLSIVGLVTGLMFLGAIFFGTGFLTAYKTFPSAVMDQRHPWHAANEDFQSTSQNTGLEKKNRAFKQVERVADRYVSRKVNHELGYVNRAEEGVIKKIPGPLHVFAQHAQNQANTHFHHTIQNVGTLTKQNVRRVLSGQPSHSQPPTQAVNNSNGGRNNVAPIYGGTPHYFYPQNQYQQPVPYPSPQNFSTLPSYPQQEYYPPNENYPHAYFAQNSFIPYPNGYYSGNGQHYQQAPAPSFPRNIPR